MKLLNITKILLIAIAFGAISGCKIELDIFGKGEVQTTSGTFDCSSDGTTESGDCEQTYNDDANGDDCDFENDSDCTRVLAFRTAVNLCPGYQTGDTWADHPTCKYQVDEIGDCPGYDANDTAWDTWDDANLEFCVMVVTDIADCDHYGDSDGGSGYRDTWQELLHCSPTMIIEQWVATPDDPDDNTYWGDSTSDYCQAGGNCSIFISNADANNDGTTTIDVHFESTPANQDATYTYNFLGQRVSKTVASVITYYQYDEQGNLLGEYDSSGGLVKEYVYAEGELVGWVDETGDTSASEDLEQLFFPANDHLGRPHVSIRRDQKIAGEHYFDPFGKSYALFSNSSVGTGPTDINQRLPGQYYDEETGYDYNWYRTYDPSIGRYLQSDPIGLRGGVNTFGYVMQNPVMFVDFMGLAITTPGGGSIIQRPDGTYCDENNTEDEFTEEIIDILNSIAQSSPATEDMINRLIDSDNNHIIRHDEIGVPMTDPFNANNAQNGSGTGTTVYVDPYNDYTSSNGQVVDPSGVLEHELKHADEMDQGIFDKHNPHKNH